MRGRHQDSRHRQGTNKFKRVDGLDIVQWRTLHLHQHVDRHAFGMRFLFCQLFQQRHAVGTALSHADNTATTDMDAGFTHMTQRIQSLLVGSGGNNLPVEFR